MKNNRLVLLLFIILFSFPKVSIEASPDNAAHKIIVVAVRFRDISNSTDLTFIKNRVFIEMNEYYQEVSFNKTWITGDILDYWVDIPKNMSYYGNYSNNNHTLGARKLLEDAISFVDNTTDFSNYDSIIVVHTSDDEASSRNETDIRSWGWWDGLRLTTNDDITFQQGAVVSEKDPLGIFCHEFGHILGLPDLYNTNESDPTEFIGQWGVMGKGNWNDNGSHPSHPIAWSKIQLGWIEPTQIMIVSDKESVVTVEPLEEQTAGIQVVKIPTVSLSIYYLIEVRRRILFDEYLPSEGVLIKLINEILTSGKGIVKVIDAVNRTRSLNDSFFFLRIK